jgi:dipeptidase D
MRIPPRILGLLALTLLLGAPLPAMAAPAATAGCAEYDDHLAAAAKRVSFLDAGVPGPRAFAAFLLAASRAYRVVEDSPPPGGPNEQMDRLKQGAPVAPVDARLAACVLRRYTLARYGDRMVKDLQELIGFQTFAMPETAGQENWDLPEFKRQRAWLAKRAGELGFAFKSYDGRVEELTLPGPEPILALLTHGDVQGVEGQEWKSPPFAGRIVEGKIVGRGTEDDKGPLVAALYALAALHDSGWPLDSTLRLLVANGEETSWDEIPYYLARAPMPDRTVGVDAAYPVTHAQKGYGIVTFRAQPLAANAEPKGGSWRVVRMSGGSGMSIIAERGEAVLERVGASGDPAKAHDELASLAAAWSRSHPPAQLAVAREGNLLKLTAVGHGGHSSQPASGHNALGDLTAFLATLDLRMDPWGALASFVGIAVGTETNGAALGLAHRDPVMGELTANLSFLRDDKGAPVAEINIRYPRGIAKPEMEKQLADRTAAFTRRAGAGIAATANLTSEPHLAPADTPLVASLLAVWNDVTGKPGRPIAIGGGTQARLFKGGVDFGPAEDMEHYRGHGTDEYLTPDELHRIAELTVAAVWKLAGPQPAAPAAAKP